MRSRARVSSRVADSTRPQRGIIDTSVVIDLEAIDPTSLPFELAVSSVTMAELAAGPHATDDPDERARRQDRLQRAEAALAPLPFAAESGAPSGGAFSGGAGAGAGPAPAGRSRVRRAALRRRIGARLWEGRLGGRCGGAQGVRCTCP